VAVVGEAALGCPDTPDTGQDRTSIGTCPVRPDIAAGHCPDNVRKVVRGFIENTALLPTNLGVSGIEEGRYREAAAYHCKTRYCASADLWIINLGHPWGYILRSIATVICACAASLAACATPNPTEKIIANDPFIGKDLWLHTVLWSPRFPQIDIARTRGDARRDDIRLSKEDRNRRDKWDYDRWDSKS